MCIEILTAVPVHTGQQNEELILAAVCVGVAVAYRALQRNAHGIGDGLLLCFLSLYAFRFGDGAGHEHDISSDAVEIAAEDAVNVDKAVIAAIVSAAGNIALFCFVCCRCACLLLQCAVCLLQMGRRCDAQGLSAVTNGCLIESRCLLIASELGQTLDLTGFPVVVLIYSGSSAVQLKELLCHSFPAVISGKPAYAALVQRLQHDTLFHDPRRHRHIRQKLAGIDLRGCLVGLYAAFIPGGPVALVHVITEFLHIHLQRYRPVRNINSSSADDIILIRKAGRDHLLAHLIDQVVEAVVYIGKCVGFVERVHNLRLGESFLPFQP